MQDFNISTLVSPGEKRHRGRQQYTLFNMAMIIKENA